MKKTTTITLVFAASALLAIYFSCEQPTTTPKPKVDLDSSLPSILPQDVLQSCIYTQSEFDSLFNKTYTASENGIVNPPNSLEFSDQTNCDFYKWSWQMFAWLVSPTIIPNETVMEAPEFYTVSPVNASKQRTLIPHVQGQALRATSSITQAGPNGLATIRDKQGNRFEVEKHDPAVKPMLLTGERVHSVEMDAAGKHVFKDKTGKVISNPKAQTKAKGKVVKEFKATNGTSVFVGADGIVESEEGQAGSNGGLMSQNNSIVYYITMVNDVYAVFLSADKTNQLPPNNPDQFPTTEKELESIIALAKTYQIPLADSTALAIEIKSSWVEASTLSNVDDYVTIEAIIPIYDTTDSLLWTQIDEKTVKLAMLGIHVVGSTKGHPEMIWATFEHQENSPFASYDYLNKDSVKNTVPADAQGPWTLSAGPPSGDPINPNFTANESTLTAVSGSSISPSDISLVYPWGSEMGHPPNNMVSSSAESNSELISLNNSVLGLLIGDDMRKNYLMMGATWTDGGVAPTGALYSNTTGTNNLGAAVGTSLMANSTLESFVQDGTTSCFSCHNKNNSLAPADLSHVYGGLQALSIFE